MQITVDAKGRGDFLTVQEAVNSVPDHNDKPVTIYIRKGVYEEKLLIPKEKTFIRLVGEDNYETILTFSDNALKPGPEGKPMGTFKSGSTIVHADDFRAENLTFRNSSGPGTGQAVAAFMNGDRMVFKNVRFLGDQDTLYTGPGRHYYVHCYLEGDVDFLFGPATAVFERCHLHCKRDGAYLTATNTPEDQPYGYVFLDCSVSGTPGAANIYLGRPWRDFAAVAFIRTWMDGSIAPAGWHNWSLPHREETSRYTEYGTWGPGASTANRVDWARYLTEEEAAAYDPAVILAGSDNWSPFTDEVPKTALQVSARLADQWTQDYPLAKDTPWGSDRWHYEHGCLLKGISVVESFTEQDRYFRYILTNMNRYVEADGTIRTYKLEEYNLDQVNQGKLLLYLWKKTSDNRYKQAADRLIRQLETHPRTSEGGFWHKKIYPHQMWLDGLYMATPFLTEYARIFDRPELLDEAPKQLLLIEKHTRDEATGLLYHGWDESRSQGWANSETGCSPHFWSRAMGWYAMALVDTLEHLPANHPGYAPIGDALKRLAEAVTKVQDPASGLWYQIADQGSREGNYLEASGSAMFVYALAKGVSMGLLSEEYLSAARKGYKGLVNRLIHGDETGKLHLSGICRVAGLGGEPYRPGTFDYYVGEPIVEDDPKAIGACLMALAYIEAMGLAG